MYKRILFLFIAIILNFVYSIELYAERLSYTRLSEHDWKIPTARTIYKEGGKYLWIGTQSGIYRFNGYNFKHYFHTHNFPNLHGTYTYNISMDSEGSLWAVTNKGIELYDKSKDLFQLTSLSEEVKGPYFSSCLINGGVMFGGQNKIAFYSYKTKELTLFKHFDKVGPETNFMYIHTLDDNHIILYNENDILKLNIKDKTTSRIKCSSRISCMFLDSQRRIWVGCYDKTLTCFDALGKKIETYSHLNSPLSNEIILSMEQQDSLLWIGTDGGGINLLNISTGEIEIIKHTRGNHYSLPSNSINCLYKDNNNTMWAGTVRDGIVAIRKSSIHSYVESAEGNVYGLSNATILSFYQDKNKSHLWIGTDGEGINKLDLNSRIFTHYPSTKGLKVVSIAKYDERTLLLYIYTKGLFLFDMHTGKLRPSQVNKEQLRNVYLQTQLAINFYNISPNNILALTNKIYQYNTKSNSIEEIPFEKQKRNEVLLPIGKYQDLFYCYNKAAIYRLDPHTKTLKTVFKSPASYNIHSATIDNSGKIWMATNHGVLYYSMQENKSHLIQNSLINQITSIVADKKGRIWMAKGDKIFSYVESTNNLSTFGTTDGVVPNEYIDKSHFITAQGDILFGGNKGLTIIDADFEFNSKEIPSIILTGMTIDGKELNEHNLTNITSYKVPAECKSLEIQVTTIEKDILRPRIYKYEIKGENEQTIESYSPTLKFNTFSPGKSIVYVSCGTRNGEWSQPKKIITLIFLPPWYKTGWFYTICFILTTGVVVSIISTVIRRKETKLKLMMKENEKRIYKEKVEFLININHELRPPLTLISGPLKRLLQITSETSTNYDTLKKIHHQTERMKKLLNMVLDLRKMEVGEKALRVQSHEVNKWLSAIITDFNFSEDFSNYSIKTEFSDQVGMVNFDNEKCEIILTNLLMNAIKHSNQHDVILVKSEITPDNMLTISVSDQGQGLKGCDKEQLFNRFYQGNDEKNGSGIGLSYAKLLVDLHKGQIGAYNNETKGATFYFKLPLDLETGSLPYKVRPYLNELFAFENKSISNDAIANLQTYQTDHKTILIVDDNTELTDFLKGYLEPKFKEVYTACNGCEALNMIKNNGVDIIVSDIMMPEMDGYELCRNVKNDLEFSHIPILLLTAMNEESCKRLGYKMGADAYIPKPFDVETLYEIIKSKLKIREEIKHKYIQLSVIPEPQEDTFSQVDETFLMQLNTIIIDNISDTSLDIPFVCKEIGMSRASLYKKLKALTDMSCNEYIIKIRLERALNLITTTQKSFIEIADETGFANSRYFSTIIKQHTGLTPTQYRKEHKQESNDVNKA